MKHLYNSTSTVNFEMNLRRDCIGRSIGKVDAVGICGSDLHAYLA